MTDAPKPSRRGGRRPNQTGRPKKDAPMKSYNIRLPLELHALATALGSARVRELLAEALQREKPD